MTGHIHLAYDYPVLGAFWTMMWIFLWVLWIFLLVRILMDIFRDDDLNGWGKAGWCAFILILPFLGVLVYLLARGKGMGKREAQHVAAQQQAFDRYVRETAGTRPASDADELSKLSELKAKGDITEEEFQRAKVKILG